MLERVAKAFGSFFGRRRSVGEDPFTWQMGGGELASTPPLTAFSAVFACVSIISSDVARLPVTVWQTRADNGRDPVTGSAVARVLRRPNGYQTRSDFMQYALACVLLEGNFYALVERDGTGAPMALHPLQPFSVEPRIGEDGAVYYRIQADRLAGIDGELLVPARDIFHHRTQTLTHPLVGVSPITAAAVSAGTGLRILSQSDRFFANLSRPSGIVSTDKVLSKEALARVKSIWTAAQSGGRFGSVAFFDAGLKWQPLTMTASDAQLIEQLKFSVGDVARAYRVPTFLLGDLGGATYKNAETLMGVYYQQTLSWHCESLENRLDDFFAIGPAQYVEFDLDQLLRAEYRERIEAKSRGVQQGIFTPNEARISEGLNPMPGGDALFMQTQMVPLDRIGGEDDDADDADGDDIEDETMRALIRARIAKSELVN